MLATRAAKLNRKETNRVKKDEKDQKNKKFGKILKFSKEYYECIRFYCFMLYRRKQAFDRKKKRLLGVSCKVQTGLGLSSLLCGPK